MKTHFLSYGNQNFKKSVLRIAKEAEKLGFDRVSVYTELDLPDDFRQEHSEILKIPRLGGYSIWKPYLALKTIREMDVGDMLVYADAGCTLRSEGISRLREYYEIASTTEAGILTFLTRAHMPDSGKLGKYSRYVEKEWNKWDLIELLQAEEYLEEVQLASGAFVIRKSNKSTEFLERWYEISNMDDYHYLNDAPSRKENHFDYCEHRHDQSIFSLLARKYEVAILEDELLTFHSSLDLANAFPIWATRIRE